MTYKTSPLDWTKEPGIWFGNSGLLHIFNIQELNHGNGFLLCVNMVILLSSEPNQTFSTLDEAKIVAQAYWDEFLEMAGLLK